MDENDCLRPPSPPIGGHRQRMDRPSAGFTLVELLVAMGVLMVVSGTAMSGVLNMTRTQLTVSNRTEMHAGVRNATELLQQEVGQAGRVALPATVTLGGGVSAGNATVAVTSVGGMFVGLLAPRMATTTTSPGRTAAGVGGDVANMSGKRSPVKGSCVSMRRVPAAGCPFRNTKISGVGGAYPGGDCIVLKTLGFGQPGSTTY